jgi:Uma2 family endonuclease
MGMSAIRYHWTTDQVAALQQESRHWPRYELIDGELTVTPGPEPEHQLAVQLFLRIIADYTERYDIGTAFTSPADIRLIPESIVQPDLFVIPPVIGPRPERKPKWSDVKRLVLAVEIISPSSVRTDRIQKRELYMNAGVPDYWVIDLDGRFVEQWSATRMAAVPCVDVLRWQPASAPEALVIELVPLFQKITGKRII